jgi:hypothetical protein
MPTNCGLGWPSRTSPPPTNWRLADSYYVRPAGVRRKPELPKNGEDDPADRLAVGVRGTA